MIRSFLREAFDRGLAPFYILAAAPFGVMVSFAFPGQFVPFALAVFLFPVFFYHVRRGMYAKTFLMMMVWAAVQFAAVAALAALAPDFTAKWLYGASHVLEPGQLPDKIVAPAALSGQRAIELAFIAALSAISGGAFELVVWTAAANGAAFTAGKLVNSGAGAATAMILSIEPWELSYHAGHALAAIAIAAVFYMKLERKPLELTNPLKYLALGLALTALGVYFEISLSGVWMQAISSSVTAN